MIQKNYEQLIRELEREIILLKEKYRILEETTPAILFEYIPDTDKMLVMYNLPNNKEKKEISGYMEHLESNTPVHPEHMELFKSVLQDACVRSMKGEIEYLSMISGSSDYQWHKAYYSSIADCGGNVISVIGRIHNTHDTVVEMRRMQHRVETDDLTGFYNKEGAVQKISVWLQRNPTKDAYMLLLDLINFKNINDRYGHIFGDEVLLQVAQIIRERFGDDCILSRIGGAEFILFAAGMDIRTMESKTDSLMRQLTEGITSMSSPLEFNIGIAGRVGRDDDFEEMFGRADNAIYFAKTAGKNQYYIAKE